MCINILRRAKYHSKEVIKKLQFKFNHKKKNWKWCITEEKERKKYNCWSTNQEDYSQFLNNIYTYIHTTFPKVYVLFRLLAFHRITPKVRDGVSWNVWDIKRHIILRYCSESFVTKIKNRSETNKTKKLMSGITPYRKIFQI